MKARLGIVLLGVAALSATVMAAEGAGQQPASAPGDVQDRDRFFIGETIANLRGLDPMLLPGRTLMLIDGRRPAREGVGRSPAPAIPYQIRAIETPAGWRAGTVAERRACGPDGCSAQADLLLRRADGTLRVVFRNLTGPFIALAASHRVFDCARGRVDGPTASESQAGHAQPSFVDLDGTRNVLPVPSGAMIACDRIGTGDQVLRLHEDAALATRLVAQVYGADGALLAEGSFDAPGTLPFRVADVLHAADIPAR